MKKIVLTFILWGMFFSAMPQKVAVVLSGGGAKGVTHIGVLKALEEAGIPIDYIAGTSMGAIIGGLYAAGYSPDEMEKIITSEEFTQWVSGKLDPKYTYFFRQPEPDASWLNVRFKYDSVLQTQLPTNIVSPVRMDVAFLKLFASASAVADYNFDNLMVPFRCVAADIHASKPFILQKGDLGSSIRASMTYPFYFKPIKIDGRLLFDGGMYNNFPSDVVMHDFFPDIIIGSKAAANYKPPAENDIKSQLSNMLMNQTAYNLFCDVSVMIEPQLEPVNVIDFSKTRAFIDSGYVATQRLIPQIRQFVMDTVSKGQHEQIREHFNARKPEMRIKNVEVHGLNLGQDLYIANTIMGGKYLQKRFPNNLGYTTFDAAMDGYFKILGEERVQSAYPTLRFDKTTGYYTLVIDGQYDNNILTQLGGSLSSGASNELFVQIQYNYWRKIATTAKLNGYFGRFYNSALVGGLIEFPGKKPVSITLDYTFNLFNYFHTRSFFFSDQAPSFITAIENFVHFGLLFPLKSRGLFEIGMYAGQNIDKYFQTNAVVEKDKLDRTEFPFFAPYISTEINTLNRKQYANEGFRIFAQAQYVRGKEIHEPGTTSPQIGDYFKYHEYLVFKFNYQKYFKTWKLFRPGLSVNAAFSTLKPFRNYTSTALALPAFIPFYETATGYHPAYRSPLFIAIGEHNVFRINKKLDFRLDAFVMAPYKELRNVNHTPSYSEGFNSLHYAAATALVYTSPLGPISASLIKYDDTKAIGFFFNLGFLIFNKSPID